MAASNDNRHGLLSLDLPDDPLRQPRESPAEELSYDARPDASQEGADGTDSVWVSVNAAGVAVDVSISRTWSRRLEPWQLGDAILEAYGQAGRKLAAARQAAGAPAADAAAEYPWVFERGPDIGDPRWLGWVQETVGALTMRLDELERLEAGPDPAAPTGTGGDDAGQRYVAGPQGYVRVRVSADAVTGVVVDAPGYAVGAPDAVGQDALAAFMAAARALAAGGEERR